jgi:hypothetical protein
MSASRRTQLARRRRLLRRMLRRPALLVVPGIGI